MLLTLSSLKATLSGFATRVSSASVRYASQGFAREIQSIVDGPVLFIPYPSRDCISLHNGVKYALRGLGLKCETLNGDFNVEINKFLTLTPDRSLNFAFTPFSIKEACRTYEIHDLWLPLIDSIIREAPPGYLIDKFYVSFELFQTIRNFYRKVCEVSGNYDSCFLADASYIRNNMFKQAFLKSGKKVFYLNPRGTFLEYVDIYRSEFSVDFPVSDEFKKYADVVNGYLQLRFSGKSKRDLDSSKAFSSYAGLKHSRSRRKVLYLHAFKDANNNNWSPSQIFHTYVEWVDYTLSFISREDLFENWYIKPHPSAGYYEGDDLILNHFIDKYAIPSACLDLCPGTGEILDQRWPIYTNQGTIVLEAASLGYCAYFCGTRFDSSLGVFASTLDDWDNCLLRSVDEYKPLQDASLSIYAQFALWRSFEYRNIAALCPDIAIQPGDRFPAILKNWLTQIRNSLLVRPGAEKRINGFGIE